MVSNGDDIAKFSVCLKTSQTIIKDVSDVARSVKIIN